MTCLQSGQHCFFFPIVTDSPAYCRRFKCFKNAMQNFLITCETLWGGVGGLLTWWFSTGEQAAGHARRRRARQRVNAHNESWAKFYFLCLEAAASSFRLAGGFSYFIHSSPLQQAVMLVVYTSLLNGSTHWLWAADTTPCCLAVTTQLFFPL